MSNIYQAYMIRFTRNDNEAAWRVLLRSADGETTEHFATERELFLYLMERLAQEASFSKTGKPLNEST